MKKWIGRGLLFLLGLAVALFFLEILSRIFWARLSELENVSSISFVSRSDHRTLDPPRIFWPGQVGNIREFSVETVRNRLGFHDTEHAFQKPEDTFRIIFIGDSFTEAIQVPLEKTFHNLIGQRMNGELDFPVEIVSLGRSGSGTQKSLDILRETGLRFQPDLVVMQFLSNDLIDNSPPLKKEEKEQGERRNRYIPSLKEAYMRFLWVGFSRFNQLLALKLGRLYQGSQVSKHADQDKYGFIHLNTLIFCEEFAHLWERAWRRTQRIIRETQKLAEERGFEFLLVSFPEMWRVGSADQIDRRMRAMSRDAPNLSWDFNKTDKILREFCIKEGIPFLSLLPRFQESYRKSGEKLHFSYDMHLNERGHRVAADAILDYLQRKNMISN